MKPKLQRTIQILQVVEQHQENVNKAGEEETETSSGNTFGWTTEDQAQYIY